MTTPTNPQASTMHQSSWLRRHRRWLIGLAGILVSVCILFGIGKYHRLQTRRKIDTKLAAIRSQGLPTTLTELDAFYPKIPDAENGTIPLMQFQQHFVDWDDVYAPWIGVLTSNSVLYVTNPITPAARTELKSIITSNRTALSCIYDAAAKKRWRYPLDYSKSGGVRLPHTMLKDVSRLLRLQSLHHLAEGRNREALKSVEASFIVADSLAAEPDVLTFLVRKAMLGIAIGNIQTLLQRTEFSASDLALVQQAITTSESKTDLIKVMQGERASVVGSWKESVKSYNGYQQYGPATPFDELPTPLQMLGWNLYRYGGYQEEDILNFLTLHEELASIAKQAPVKALSQAEALEKRLSSPEKPRLNMVMTTYHISMCGAIFRFNSDTIAQLRVAQTALAAERFRMEQGRLPKDLGELLPQYLSSTPVDPFTQAPLRYRVTENGFRVYSVGKNTRDDGGLTRQEKPSKENDDFIFVVEKRPN